MSDIAVRVDGLSKQYRIGARKKDHGTLRDHIVANLKSLFGRNGHSRLSRNAGSMDSAEASGRIGYNSGP